MSQLSFNSWTNLDGSENYKVRAWVNFNGTGTVAIRASGNVSSITDNGVGDYTINFTVALLDANYVTVGDAQRSNTNDDLGVGFDFPGSGRDTYSTTAVRIRTRSDSVAGTYEDSTRVNIAVFR